jgi:cation:H+ antiporter
VKALTTWIESTGALAPWWFLALFIAGSLLMLWRLEAMSKSGFEGTVLGTLIMPYCSGMGNLIFAILLGIKGGKGEEVLTNALVNNVSNMTLLIGLPAVFWGMNVLPPEKAKGAKKKKRSNQQQHQVNRLSLLLTLTAALFFTGATWALGRDGALGFSDGLVLVGLFLFWQCFHVFDVLRSNVRQNKSFTWKLPLDLALLGVGAYAIYLSTDWLVDWVGHRHTGVISVAYLGVLSGLLMALPNGILAVYYAWRGNPEVVYTSQVGDGHISIPLSIGIFALYRTIYVPDSFNNGVYLLLGAAMVHFFFVALFGRLPRWMGVVLTLAYAVFLIHRFGS